jgi:predicted cupin superfamily sugar epimerase
VDAETLIEHLGLEPHPSEGGFFKETYRAAEQHAAEALPDRYGAPRAYGTAIYYLLTPDTVSALHRLETDEVFHFYLGDPVEMLQLHPRGGTSIHVLGQDIADGMVPQLVVPRGVWQGARLVPGGAFALMGCTVAPGFDFDDYEHGERGPLTESYPDEAERIGILTPDG